MGSIVEFPSNGSTGSGYFAPADGGGPGVIVIQEWWGLVPHIIDVCDRFAAAGFSALAPDLYHGDAASNSEPDEAGKLMMALSVSRAAKDMSGAVKFLQGADAVTSDGVGVIGFCMGGGYALALATDPTYRVVSTNYGGCPKDAEAALEGACPIVASYGGVDTSPMGASAGQRLDAALTTLGVDHDVKIYPNAGRGSMNDHDPADQTPLLMFLARISHTRYDPDATEDARHRIVEFFQRHLVADAPG